MEKKERNITTKSKKKDKNFINKSTLSYIGIAALSSLITYCTCKWLNSDKSEVYKDFFF